MESAWGGSVRGTASTTSGITGAARLVAAGFGVGSRAWRAPGGPPLDSLRTPFAWQPGWTYALPADWSAATG
ncbi:hypothetical protein [Streptomyces litchfieldiae]|uniref:Uncharacterized protein n=1 Tax=Streptomyces litchfieldiae TaxID=3075543 RepID=A0ABU2N2G9_9ACTN|nr:hypothetical protein [Streptomyces sp. DSM 44938]MDT0346929.1 hypothetical protein [Streptomyces sp. DSM 44938]